MVLKIIVTIKSSGVRSHKIIIIIIIITLRSIMHGAEQFNP